MNYVYNIVQHIYNIIIVSAVSERHQKDRRQISLGKRKLNDPSVNRTTFTVAELSTIQCITCIICCLRMGVDKRQWPTRQTYKLSLKLIKTIQSSPCVEQKVIASSFLAYRFCNCNALKFTAYENRTTQCCCPVWQYEAYHTMYRMGCGAMPGAHMVFPSHLCNTFYYFHFVEFNFVPFERCNVVM